MSQICFNSSRVHFRPGGSLRDPSAPLAANIPCLLESQMLAVLDDDRLALAGLHKGSCLLLELHEVSVEALDIPEGNVQWLASHELSQAPLVPLVLERQSMLFGHEVDEGICQLRLSIAATGHIQEVEGANVHALRHKHLRRVHHRNVAHHDGRHPKAMHLGFRDRHHRLGLSALFRQGLHVIIGAQRVERRLGRHCLVLEAQGELEAGRGPKVTWHQRKHRLWRRDHRRRGERS
mmetsp:Transcript_79115/g.256509  ORF Transcript_79115/g.256509 Transcript_79115/m.256509 type:complete len:235 (-) Transcript_79115:41-745(-)